MSYGSRIIATKSIPLNDAKEIDKCFFSLSSKYLKQLDNQSNCDTRYGTYIT